MYSIKYTALMCPVNMARIPRTPPYHLWYYLAHNTQLKQFDTYNVMTLFVGDYYNWIEVAEMMPDV
jgi:hypothetical protein